VVVDVVDAFEGWTVFVWILAALLRLEPKPRLLKRELMTSTAKRKRRERVAFKRATVTANATAWQARHGRKTKQRR
jgi:hypothetical protein